MLRDPIRILIGDEIGLGKTITAIVLGRYLQDVGRVKKILVLVPRILVPQWEEELRYWYINVFRIESRKLGVDSHVIVLEPEDLARNNLPDGWYVVSIDLVARNKRVFKAVSQVNWDLVIVDEAHKLSPQTAKKRWKFIGEELIAKHPERNVLLLSATPHKGFPDDYIARLQILDPLLEADIRALDSKRFYKQTWNTLVFRRMKRDVNDIYEEEKPFVPAKLQAILIKPTDLEAEFYRKAESFLLELLKKYKEASGVRSTAVRLLVALLAKRAFSSPASACSTLFYMATKRAGRLKRLSKKEAEKRADALRKAFLEEYYAGDYAGEVIDLTDREKAIVKEVVGKEEFTPDDILNAFAHYASNLLDEDDIEKFKELLKLAEEIRKREDSKTLKLEELVKYHLSEGSKIIIFTEYTDTAYYVAEKIKKIAGDAVKVLTGREARSRKEREDVEEGFIKGDKYKILISTDVLSEGLNLQVANVLINYDLPWTPLKLEQRIGRVWRLGQKKECFIYMLVVGSSEQTTGASRVVSKLYKKLLNMEKAQQGKINLILGEDVEIYVRDLSERAREEISVLAGEVETEKDRKTETEVILASLDDKRFEEFVNWYITAIEYLKNRIVKQGVDPEIRREVKREIAGTVGFSSRKEIRSFLLTLARSLAKIKEVLEIISENKEAIRGSLYQKPLQEMHPKELIEVIQNLSKDASKLPEPFSITLWGAEDSAKIDVLKVSLLVEGKPRYEEILGVDEVTEKVLSSIELLEKLTPLVDKPYQVSEYTNNIDMLWIKSLIDEYMRKKLFAQGINDIGNYVASLSRFGLRSGDEWNKVTSFNEIKIEIKPLAVIKLHKECPTEIIDRLVGEYDEKKAEIEDEAIAILTERLSSRFNIHDMHKVGAPFDLILIGKNGSESPEHRIVEVKSWKHIDLVIYTGGEKAFGEENERKGGNYWLYIVDMRKESPRVLGFKQPFTTGAVELIKKVTKKGRDYYVYRIAREADEVW